MAMPKLIVHVIVAAAMLSSGVAFAQDPSVSHGQDFANCAGAVAAHTGLNIADYHPSTRRRPANEGWPGVLSRILEGLNRQPGLEGMTGFEAARASRLHWAEQPRAAQQAQAETCRAEVEGH
jgi:hypothetical protein